MEVNFSPLVSIVIPVYNGSDYLAEAIDSALNQTYKNIEILVINDGSTDEGKTSEVALVYGDKIRYFEKENGGVSTALNFGIHAMRGDYFSWLSHDDVYFPKKIERQIEFLKERKLPDAITYTDFCCITSTSEVINEIKVREIDPASFKMEFILGGLLHGCSLLIPKECFKVSGYFDESLRATQDFDLWFRFSEAGFNFYHIPEILVKWRLHEQQVAVKRKALCDEESTLMYTDFLKRMSRNEIRNNYTGSTIEYYLRYSNKMMEYGYLKPAWYAFKLSTFSIRLFKPRNILLMLRTTKRLLKYRISS